jgi:LemA protein
LAAGAAALGAAASVGSEVAAAAAVAAVLVGNVGEMENTMKLSVRRTLMSVGLVIAAIGLSGCSYNRFVTQEESIKAQWAQVENQLQRRNDLIPNLVETVKGFAQQERDVFGQIADSRAKLAGARTPEQTIQAANEQSAALARLLVITENYPQLRSNESFNRLMDELSGTENRIAVERMRYNERVQEYNTSRRQFPSNLTASIFGFKEYPLFNAPPEAERVPKVNFGRQSS